MVAYWTTFARTGDPNRPGSVPWARLGAVDGRVQSLAAGGIATVPFAENHRCDFWLNR
jgi:para-nitrobenzyl esterase